MFTLLIVAAVALTLLAGCQFASRGTADGTAVLTVKDQTPIGEAFEKGFRADNVQMAEGASAVELYDLNLVEDDGPGACSAHGPHAPGFGTTVRAGVQAKKVLHLDREGVLGARLVFCVGPEEGEKAPLHVAVNGRSFRFARSQYSPFAEDWASIRVPASLLRPGDNEVVFSCEGEKGWWLNASRREHILLNAPDRKDRPRRSFRSADGGRTWSQGLGDDGSLDGEFMVRLHVDQYVAQGELIGPVIDLAALVEGAGAIAPDVRVKGVRLRASKKVREGTGIALSVRSGTSPVHDEKTWGPWLPCSVYGNAQGDLHRFVQWRAVLTSRRGKSTPLLENVELLADVRPVRPDWAGRVRLLDSHNEEIRFTSIPFEYERFDEPPLVELRAKYKLDEVVAGAKDELEKMIRLRHWVETQWKYVPPVPNYPAWDAREILEQRRGFCVQYAIVYMQCMLSLGMQTRFVFGKFPNVFLRGNWVSGHEVCEVWSNDLGKWVMMDPQRDEAFVSRSTGQVCTMMELHKDQLDTFFPGGIDGKGASFDADIPSEGVLWWKGLEPQPRPERPVLDIKWGYLFWPPRNNFYAHRYPEPVQQGMGWAWTGYWLWQDDRTPRQLRFGRYTRRLSDVEWTINQVRWSASAAEQEGTIRLNLGTVTPDFDTYLVSLDRGEWRPAGSVVDWPLHAGRNRIEMRIRTRAGILGRKSFVEVEYAAAK